MNQSESKAESGLVARGDGRFEISGRLTFHSVPDLFAKTAQWLNDTQGSLTFDLGKVTLADSAGLALMIEWMHQARTVQREIKFVNFPEQMKHLITVSGLDQAFGLA